MNPYYVEYTEKNNKTHFVVNEDDVLTKKLKYTVINGNPTFKSCTYSINTLQNIPSQWFVKINITQQGGEPNFISEFNENYEDAHLDLDPTLIDESPPEQLIIQSKRKRSIKNISLKKRKPPPHE